MPYFVTSKDQIKLDGIPDDVPKTDPRVKAAIEQLRAAGQQSGVFGQLPTVDSGAPSTTDLGSAQGGLTQEETGRIDPNYKFKATDLIPKAGDIGAVARGVVGGAASGITAVTNPVVAIINGITGRTDLLPSEGLQHILDKLGVPESKTRSQQILQAATAGVAGAATDIAAGQAMSAMPGTAGGVGEVLAAQPKAQLLGGATGGAASQAASSIAADSGASPLVQTIAGLAGGLAGGAVGGVVGNAKVTTQPLPEGLLADAKANKVRIMTSDVRPPSNPVTQLARSIGELVGTGSDRAKQQTARAEAVRNLGAQYGVENLDVASNAVIADLIAKRRADLLKWGTSKDEVFAKLSDSANPVPMSATNKKIDDTIAELERISPTTMAGAINELKTWKTDLQNKDLATIEDLRSTIGETFAKLRPQGMADVPTIAEKKLMSIYPSVNEDMGNYIKSNGGNADFTKWQVANKNLSDMMKELQLSSLKRALNKGETTPELIKGLIFSKDKSTVRALYDNLSPEGQKSMQSAVLTKAMQDVNGDAVSPSTYMTNIKRLGDKVGIVFSDKDLEAVKGLTRVLEYTQHAEQKQLGLPNNIKGTLMLPLAVSSMLNQLGGGAKGISVALAGGAALGGMAKLYESAATRTLLSKLPRLKPGSNEEDAVLKAIMTAAQTLDKAPKSDGPAVAPTKPDQYGSTNYPGAPGMTQPTNTYPAFTTGLGGFPGLKQ